jgi:hypothetical protein
LGELGKLRVCEGGEGKEERPPVRLLRYTQGCRLWPGINDNTVLVSMHSHSLIPLAVGLYSSPSIAIRCVLSGVISPARSHPPLPLPFALLLPNKSNYFFHCCPADRAFRRVFAKYEQGAVDAHARMLAREQDHIDW